jgi:hypothetical protein
MSAWEFIGWMIAVPMAFFVGLFVIAVVVAVVRATVRGVNKSPSNVTPIRRPGNK